MPRHSRLPDRVPHHPRTRPCQGHKKYIPVDPRGWVVLDSEIGVLADAKAKIPRLTEVLLQELVLLDIEATLEDLEGLLATDSDMNGWGGHTLHLGVLHASVPRDCLPRLHQHLTSHTRQHPEQGTLQSRRRPR